MEEKAGGGEAEEPFITFSAKFTILNLLISMLGIVAYCLSMTQIAGWDRIYGGIPVLLHYYLYSAILPGTPAKTPFILVPILGLFLTLLTLVLTSTHQTCCNRRSNCSSTCFNLPRVEHGALLVSDPHSHFVLGDNGKPRLVPEDEEVKRDDTEMIADEKAKEIQKQGEDMVERVAIGQQDRGKIT